MDFMGFNEKIKKLQWFDISLIKVASAAAILWIITIWPAAMSWVQNTNTWWFFAAMLVFAIRPMVKFFGK